VGIVSRARDAHYTYDVPYVARWPQHGAGRTLVMYHHGGGPTPVSLLIADRLFGDANPNRYAELAGDHPAGVPALMNKATYVAFSRRGMLADGRLSAKFLPSEVSPLSSAEVVALQQQIAPGDPSYNHPDLFPGAPVPASIVVDTATVRDIDRALQQVVAEVRGVRFRERVSVGHSAGAVVTAGIAFGRSIVGATSIRTGGNHWIPYDSTSERIFDGFIFNGFPYRPGLDNADAMQPLTAPVFILQGRADERYQHPIQMAHELLQKGVVLERAVWIYEIANLPHVSRDNSLDVPAEQTHAEPIGVYLGAAIRNMREFLTKGVSPPHSRIAGRILNGRVVFDVVGGVTDSMPVLEDPLLDTVGADPQLTIRTTDAANASSWQAVTNSIDYVNAPIIGPSIACRIGGYRIQFFGAHLAPFTRAMLGLQYLDFKHYSVCIKKRVGELKDQRLYDSSVESPDETASIAASLF
jgi:hypothetical protein